MKKIIFLISVLFSFQLVSLAENPSLAYIQRTMQRISSSTEEKPETVSVMFYGQSITAQPWTNIVVEDLKRRFPSVRFEIRKPAIGGFTSPSLIRTAEHDLYPNYPDLLIFHVYGPTDKYEEIVRRVRERTTTEIVLWTSHLRADETLDKNPDQTARSRSIRNIAKKYDCMLVDIRKKWITHLKENNLNPSDFLRDSVHLNKEGVKLLGSFMASEFQYHEGLNTTPQAGSVMSLPIDSASVQYDAQSRISTLRFKGNRVVAVSNGSVSSREDIEIKLDMKDMSTYNELWTMTRPSKSPKHWMPAIKQVSYKNTPLHENWTLTCLPDSSPNGKLVHFKLVGNKTGADGEGYSNKEFVSNSGRVVIQPQDWHLAWCLSHKKMDLPENFKITWKAYPTFASKYSAKENFKETLLIQNCSNEEHVLNFSGNIREFGIDSFKVYTPAN